MGMKLASDLKNRGLVQDTSVDIEVILGEKRTIYIGTDPTADSLHVGHLAWVVLMKRMSDAGHRIILLVGGGTGMIGDPKEKGERSLKSIEEIDKNAEALAAQLRHLLGERADFQMVNNAEWLREVKMLDFLRDTGKHFTVNDLIKRDLIKRRLETPDESISYTEFTYSLLQAYDYRELNERYGCDLQIGGSDQWTNILSGVDLIRKTKGKEVFAFSFPLITDASGRKFGKSEGNAVWLNGEKTSPYQFYQFWLSVEDAKVIDYLKIYTMLSLNEIEVVEKKHNENPSTRFAQGCLADEITEFVHGKDAKDAVARASTLLFESVTLQSLSDADKKILLENAPIFTGAKGRLLVDVLVDCRLASSKREARDFIESGAITLEGEKLTELDLKIDYNDLAILKRGKKNIVVLSD